MNKLPFGALLVSGFVFILLVEPVAEVVDDYTTPQPWFDVTLVSETDGSITYARNINRWMRGEWVANVQVKEGDSWKGVCTGTGTFIYRPSGSGITNMSHEYFTGGCKKPDEVSRVCVSYVMKDRRGRQKDFGPFCT